MSARPSLRVTGTDIGASAGLPLTALIDVIFLVVIFFMINAVFSVTSAIPVELPKESGESNAVTKGVVVTVDAAGLIYIDDDLIYMGQLVDVLKSLRKNSPDLTIFVSGDASLPYQHLVDVLGAVRDAGIRAVSLLTEPTQDS